MFPNMHCLHGKQSKQWHTFLHLKFLVSPTFLHRLHVEAFQMTSKSLACLTTLQCRYLDETYRSTVAVYRLYWARIVAFYTSSNACFVTCQPMHRPHVQIVACTISKVAATLTSCWAGSALIEDGHLLQFESIINIEHIMFYRMKIRPVVPEIQCRTSPNVT